MNTKDLPIKPIEEGCLAIIIATHRDYNQYKGLVVSVGKYIGEIKGKNYKRYWNISNTAFPYKPDGYVIDESGLLRIDGERDIATSNDLEYQIPLAIKHKGMLDRARQIWWKDERENK